MNHLTATNPATVSTNDPATATSLELIQSEVIATEQQAANMRSLIHQRHGDAAHIRASIAAADGAVAAAVEQTGQHLAADATGDGDPTAIKEAREAVKSARQRADTARRYVGAADEAEATARSLAARLEKLDAQLADLRQQRKEAMTSDMLTELRAKIGSYYRNGDAVVRDFVAIVALDEALTARGAPQGIRTPDTALACVPGWAGYPANVQPLDALLNIERLKVLARWVAA